MTKTNRGRSMAVARIDSRTANRGYILLADLAVARSLAIIATVVASHLFFAVVVHLGECRNVRHPNGQTDRGRARKYRSHRIPPCRTATRSVRRSSTHTGGGGKGYRKNFGRIEPLPALAKPSTSLLPHQHRAAPAARAARSRPRGAKGRNAGTKRQDWSAWRSRRAVARPPPTAQGGGTSELGDFQPGSITGATRPCGSPSCHCAKPNDPGHGPHFQLTQKIEGKTVTQNLPSPAAVRKAEREVAEFRKFQTLTGELVDVNRKICRLRPVEQTEQTAQEKKRPKRSNKRFPAK
ncbi:MAG: DUF6788 family protein [Bryobacteraceae bacterium]